MATTTDQNEFPLQRLRIISRSYPRGTARSTIERADAGDAAASVSNRFKDIFVPLSPIDNQPFVIGTGGFATVFVAFESRSRTGKPLAVKLLKREQGSGSPNGRYRFIEEIYYNQLLSNTPAGTFVQYVGFGYLPGSPRQVSKPDEREIAWVRNGIDPMDLEDLCSANFSSAIINSGFMAGHQDLFFVMNAAWCSLEQLLVSNQPLQNSNTINLSYKRGSTQGQIAISADAPAAPSEASPVVAAEMNTVYGVEHENLKTNARALRHVQEIAEILQISDATSGLEILSAARTNPKFGVAVSTNIQLEILRKAVAAVASIHRFQARDSEGKLTTLSLAHRDLKPANFLLDDCSSDAPLVVLSDLGFIAPEHADKSLYAAFGDAREPGALPLGTVMYQAPEQMMSGREISFELIEADSLIARWKELSRPDEAWPTVQLSGVDYLAKAIRARTVGGISIEEQDRIVSSEIQLVSDADGGRMVVQKIARDPKSPTSTVVFLEQSIAVNQTPRADYKGLLLKPVGQQSDLFSLGCLAYFMASGGKDPSEFYRTYLRPPSGLIYLAGDSPHENCLDISKFLASRNGALAESGELLALLTVLKHKRWEGFKDSTAAKIKSFKVSPERDHFLFNTDGTPIGIVFLFIIVTLMCRGVPGAYVPKLDASQTAALDGCAADLKGFLKELSQAIVHEYSDVMGANGFSKLSDGGLGSLLWLRLLAASSKKTSEPSCTPKI